jgi:Uma2 family endonuclease
VIATLRPLTYDDLRELPDDGNRYEVIGGDLIVNPAPTSGHQRVLLRLIRMFDDFVRQTGAGEFFVAPFGVQLGRFDAVQPDIVYLSASRPRVANDDISIDYAPDLIVEVTSPSSRRFDRVHKAALYARSGVPEYWIVDPAERTLDVFLLQSEDFVPQQPVTDGSIVSPTLAGLRFDPMKVFCVLD